MSYSMGFIRTDTFQPGKLCVFLCMCALLMHGVFVALHLLSLQYPSFDIQFLFRSVDLLHFISLLLRISGRKIFFFIGFSPYFSRIHPFSNNLLFVCFFIINFFLKRFKPSIFSCVFSSKSVL